ncbi:MAG: hypothetical protein K9G41_07645 [Flavobacteriales bacterium]|nr:hypothetical protein [Flavobacteriales bacterium]
MAFVRTMNDIIQNLTTLEGYITGNDKTLADQAIKLVKEGESMVVYKVEGENHFAPSEFCASKGTTLQNFTTPSEDERKDANKAVAKVVGKEAFANKTIDGKYVEYCTSLGIKPSKAERIYWRLYEGGSYLEL